MHSCAAILSDLFLPAGFTLGAMDDTAPAWWAVGISVLAAAISAFGTFRPSPPLHQQFGSKAEIAAILDDLKELRATLEDIRKMESAHYEKIMEAGGMRAKTLHEKIDRWSSTVVGLAQRVSNVEGQLSKGMNNGTD